MMDDIRTMLWKEWKEFFLQRGSSRKTMLISALLPVILLGIVIPWRAGPAYADNMVALIVPALMPLLFVLVLVADSFAGERERHTLETLLATRLSDQVILLGKMTLFFTHGQYLSSRWLWACWESISCMATDT